MQVSLRDIEELKAWAQRAIAFGEATVPVSPEQLLAVIEFYEDEVAESDRVIDSLETELAECGCDS